MAYILGTEIGETLTGTTGSDTIEGLGGDDTLIGDAGNDILRGGTGNDTIYGGPGDDLLEGGDGNDRLIDDGGSDVIRGGDGEDSIHIQRNSRAVVESIQVDGGSGNDSLFYQNYTTANLTVDMGAGDDSIRLITVNGTATFTLGAGSDVFEIDQLFRLSAGAPITITDFATGALGDRLEWSAFLTAFLTTWDQNSNPFSTGHLRLIQQGSDTLLEADPDGGGNSYVTLIRFQNTEASLFTSTNLDGYMADGSEPAGEIIVGTSAGETLTGTVRSDTIEGLGGDDTLIGDAGNDILRGGTGNDTIYGGPGDDLLEGGDGNDRLIDDGGSDVIRGGDGEDSIHIQRNSRAVVESIQVDGGSGNDSLFYQNYTTANLTVDMGAGDDSIRLITVNGTATFTLGAGSDVFEIDQLFRLSAGAPITITDFATGALGDRLEWSAFLTAFLTTWDQNSNPFSTGHLRLIQQGSDTLLEADPDGGGNSYVTLIRFQNTEASGFVVENLDGYLPGAAVFGTSMNDVLEGSANNDFIYGYAGHDVLRGGAGNDVLDGGAGIDTAIYAGMFRSYHASVSSGSGVVESLPGAGGEGGTDTLSSIENVQFRDGTWTFDVDGSAAQVTRLYDTVLQRAPDQVGLDLWVDRMQSGAATLKQIANGFLNSAEFQAKTGSLSNMQYVEYIYKNSLGRPADDAGKAYWVGQLDSGAKDRADILIGFSESPEHRTNTAALVGGGFFDTDDTYQTVALIYDTFLGRRPDVEGLTYWAEAIKDHRSTISQVADGFASSPEFVKLTQGMTNGQLVEFMYSNTLDRHSDADGLAYWTGRLEAGMSRSDLFLGFSQSDEHFALLGSVVTNGIDYLS